MADTTTLLALFPDIDPASEAIERLHNLGIQDEQIDIMSGVPLLEHALGRPKRHTLVPQLSLIGATLGLIFGLFIGFGTYYLFKLYVGGQPLYPIPPAIIVVFEMSMLGVMGMAFLGAVLESKFPIYRPLKYIPEVSDGKIAIFFECPSGDEDKFIQAMQSQGAEKVEQAELRQL